MNVSTSMEWLKDGYGTDPLSTYTEYICIILFLANIQTGLYSYTMYISSTIVEINKIIWNNPKGIVTAITSWRHSEKFDETKSTILGATQSFVLISLSLLSIIPLTIVRSIAKKNIDDINHGYLRNLVYASKMLMPTFTFLLFPIIMISFNQRIKKSLIKEVKRWLNNKKYLIENKMNCC